MSWSNSYGGPILIDTPRLCMRQFVLEDAEDVYRFAANPDVVRYTGDADAVKSLEDARRIIENYWLAGYREHGFCPLCIDQQG
nr:GNAT family N-acetyltransferase [Shewanella marisflavi]